MTKQQVISYPGFTLRQVKLPHKSRPMIDCWAPTTPIQTQPVSPVQTQPVTPLQARAQKLPYMQVINYYQM